MPTAIDSADGSADRPAKDRRCIRPASRRPFRPASSTRRNVFTESEIHLPVGQRLAISRRRLARFAAAAAARTREQRRGARTLLVLVAGAFVIAGCGSAGSGAGGAHAAANVTTAHVAGYGTVLATASGQALYVLTADRPGESKCSGSCTVDWHPLILDGLPVAGPGVNRTLLSTFKRSDGRTQAMYDGHPLYAYAGSEPASLAVGTIAYGGVWYFVSPSGQAIEQTASGGY
jgi:predicted lipoprotein with Yx(FWY)xxD motif